MRVLVTGANGYIGRHAVSALLDKGADVIAADLVLSEVDPRANKLEIDIFQDVLDLYKTIETPDALLHLAWRDGFLHNSNSHMLYLSNHYNLLEKTIEAGVRHIAVMGSMHEVGYWEGSIDENTPCNPMSLYGIAKDALRRSLFQMTKSQSITVQWLRGFYIYGDDERSSSIFGKITEAVKRGEKEFPFTMGKNLCDFISVEELGRQIASVVMQKEIQGIINCCSGIPVSLADKVNEFIMEHNYHIKLKYGAFPERPYDSPGVWGDSSKIKLIMRD